MMRIRAALVLETNNLHGIEDDRALGEALSVLIEKLARQERAVGGLEELVITHDGLSASSRERVERAAERAIVWMRIAPDVGYYDAKLRGFEQTTSEVVVFADADCDPCETWLRALLEPFADPDVQVVAGRTAYSGTVLGVAANALDFPYVEGRERQTVRNFYANNVAFRREVFARFAYTPLERVYRGHCLRMGMQLWEAGVPIRFAPSARTRHALPGSMRELIETRAYRGSDMVEMAPVVLDSWSAELGATARDHALAATALTFAGRLALGARALAKARGQGCRRAASLRVRGAVLGLSVLDGGGAFMRLRGRGLGIRDGATTRQARSRRTRSRRGRLGAGGAS